MDGKAHTSLFFPGFSIHFPYRPFAFRHAQDPKICPTVEASLFEALLKTRLIQDDSNWGLGNNQMDTLLYTNNIQQ